MTTFEDGPAKGQQARLSRAPQYLRLTEATPGHWEPLVLIEDLPEAGARVVAYELVGEPQWVRVTREGRSEVTFAGTYRLVDPQPTDTILRINALWQEWALAQFELREDAAEVQERHA